MFEIKLAMGNNSKVSELEQFGDVVESTQWEEKLLEDCQSATVKRRLGLVARFGALTKSNRIGSASSKQEIALVA
jgi:hypothetical protein